MDNESQNIQGTQPSTIPASQSAVPPAAQGASGMAIAALILGITAIVCCNFTFGIPAIILGWIELKNIREGRSSQHGQTMANVGFILGIVGTTLSCLTAIAYILLVIFGASLGFLEEVGK